jgi:predicted Fe-S protein YdhL (DUF1289 family)
MTANNATTASPCIGTCRLDEQGRYCVGCRRTLREIAEWGTASEARRRAILDRIAREAAEPRSGDR